MAAGEQSIGISAYAVTHRMLKIGQNSIKCYYSYINYIYCYSVEGYLVGSISFYPEGQVPESRYSPGPKFDLCFESDKFQNIIDTFRYEKYISVTICCEDNNIITEGDVITCPEPVGEQEGV